MRRTAAHGLCVSAPKRDEYAIVYDDDVRIVLYVLPLERRAGIISVGTTITKGFAQPLITCLPRSPRAGDRPVPVSPAVLMYRQAELPACRTGCCCSPVCTLTTTVFASSGTKVPAACPSYRHSTPGTLLAHLLSLSAGQPQDIAVGVVIGLADLLRRDGVPTPGWAWPPYVTDFFPCRFTLTPQHPCRSTPLRRTNLGPGGPPSALDELTVPSEKACNRVQESGSLYTHNIICCSKMSTLPMHFCHY